MSDDDLEKLMDVPRMGPCCACECEGPQVRNVVMIDRRAIFAGHGWGCVVCGLSPDGASYVLCDDCFDAKRPPIFACRGYPGIDGRVVIEILTAPFDHDMSKHTEER